MDLIDTFVVPSFRHNLVSISNLDKFGYTYTFINIKVNIVYEDNVIGIGFLLQDSKLYLLNVITPTNLILHTSIIGSDVGYFRHGGIYDDDDIVKK